LRRPPSLLVVGVGTALALGSLVGGCRRATPDRVRPAQIVQAPEEHCWWAAFRTTLPPDSVAARSVRAYTALGLEGAAWAHRADTAWAQAGPTVLAGPDRQGAYAARVVAYRRGDTTFYRPFTGFTPLDPAARADSARVARQRITFCGDIGRAAQVGGTAPDLEEPDDAAPLWRRRP
jgi:hypothetical protein